MFRALGDVVYPVERAHAPKEHHMTCPRCQHAGDPATSSGDIAICGGCGASLVPSEDAWKPATGADTSQLTVNELNRLRKARGRTRA